MPLVLLLAVLLLVGADGAGAAQVGVDLLLLGHGVRDEQFSQRLAGGGAVGVAAAALAQQVLEEAVVGEDQLDDVAGSGSGDLDVCH